MRFVLFFLLFMPSVSAIAVAPTSLDFGEIERGQPVVREVFVANTLDFPVEYHFSGIYQDQFVLLPKEKRIVTVTLRVDVEDGIYDDALHIEERYGGNLLQGITIPVTYVVHGGDFADTMFDFRSLHIRDAETVSMYILLTGGTLALGIYGWTRRRKKGLNKLSL